MSTPGPANTARPANRLAREASPYLLQHAHNPVDWYPWGPEAFAEARQRRVPILLSIGYSTCYWCHVMERECFESEDIARELNEAFVCIKVDREERPDVDTVYMTALQIIAQGGGWPLNVWLTPPGSRDDDDKGLEPFYAGTYFPPVEKHGRPSLSMVTQNIAKAWADDREQVLHQAQRLTAAVREHLTEKADPVRIDGTQVGLATEALLRLHDRANGGFGGAPKFPQPVYLDFLLEVADAIEQPESKDAANEAIRTSLDAMAIGGIFDHVGGGFHRYSVDETWTVPHFEKMLYDNAQLLSTYARAHGRDRQAFDERVLRSIVRYVGREMTAQLPGGGTGPFRSAQDAEVDSREGLNYLWTAEDVAALVERGVLDESEAAFVRSVYGIDNGPNFQDPHHPDDPPRNVLRLDARHERIAARLGVATEAFIERFDAINEKLYRARAERKQPGTDDKVIVAWNGLMIAGLADAAAALLDEQALDLARGAADFILEHMLESDGTLRRLAKQLPDGSFDVREEPAPFEDYAMLLRGLLALHHAAGLFNRKTGRYLSAAVKLADAAKDRFATGQHLHILHDTLDAQDDMIVRARSLYDGAVPSAAATFLHALIDLHQATGERQHHEYAVACLGAVSDAVRASPLACIESTRALFRLMEIDGNVPDKLGPEVDDVPDAPATVLAAARSAAVPAAGEARVRLRIEVREGFHVNAVDIGKKLAGLGLRPLRVRIERGEGVSARLDFPEGEPYEGGAIDEDTALSFGKLPVYTGVTEGELVLERTGDAPITGRPAVILSYQACNEQSCFTPIDVELDLDITEA
jgi:uncharacterized protein YyaL (SSP411 family)